MTTAPTFDSPRRIPIVVEILPVPLDRRVWLEATTLVNAGYMVSVICPMGKGWDKPMKKSTASIFIAIVNRQRPMPVRLPMRKNIGMR